MRRAVARGRVFPQSYSTDRRYGRLSLKAGFLYPMMWANADDQGRLCGDPEEIKYAVCPNIDHITKADIPGLLIELERNELIKVYATPKSEAIQLLDWWEIHRPQWAYPSQYLPPEGWKDRLRYHPTPTEIITENWVPPSQLERELPSPLPSSPEKGLRRKLGSEDKPPSRKRIRKGNTKEEKEEEEGNIPSLLGSNSPSPSPRASPSEVEILHRLTECFKKEWGRVPAHSPYEVLPREPDARESAQLRDLAKEISSAGGCRLDYINQAFREAAGQGKHHISYARAVLLDWLGIERGPP